MKVTCNYKGKGPKSEESSYCPISNLPVFGKILESAAEQQIQRFCEVNGLLGRHQHGFRRMHSTSTALLSATMGWYENKRRGLYQGCPIIDQSAACDVLEVPILLGKAKILGFNQTAVRWLESYLTGRTQVVQMGEDVLEIIELEHGTPQGSSVSCLIYIIFICDAELWQDPKTTLIAYADDAFITVYAKSVEEMRRLLEAEGFKMFKFLASNGLVANASKSDLLVFRPVGVGRQTVSGWIEQW